MKFVVFFFFRFAGALGIWTLWISGVHCNARLWLGLKRSTCGSVQGCFLEHWNQDWNVYSNLGLDQLLMMCWTQSSDAPSPSFVTNQLQNYPISPSGHPAGKRHYCHLLHNELRLSNSLKTNNLDVRASCLVGFSLVEVAETSHCGGKRGRGWSDFWITAWWFASLSFCIPPRDAKEIMKICILYHSSHGSP